jgi:predicted lactoylglutathione lyase
MALTQGSEAERNSATRSFLEELGKDANFLFTQAGAYFLFWKGEVKRMLTTGELQQMLTRLKAQTEELKTLVQQFGSDRSRIVPETLDGEPVYALEVESADGETVQLYTNAEGVRMRMSNGQFLEESLSPAEARSRLGLR